MRLEQRSDASLLRDLAKLDDEAKRLHKRIRARQHILENRAMQRIFSGRGPNEKVAKIA
jgi:hypothetical protein